MTFSLGNNLKSTEYSIAYGYTPDKTHAMNAISHIGLFVAVVLLIVNLPVIIGRPKGTPTELIIGGESANFASWPWQAALLSQNDLVCGGTLIHTDTVLTAAHCLLGKRYEDFQVKLGDYDRYTLEESEQTIEVQSYSVHPYFRSNFLGGRDIALLHLAQNASLSHFVYPISYMADVDDKFDDSKSKCYITGWGVSSLDVLQKEPCPKSGDPYEFLSSTLQEAEIDVMSNAKCNSKRYWDGLVKDTNLCAFYKESAACEGDSGSPLVCETARGYVLAGVTSWGPASCRNYPTVFTAVAKFKHWIELSIRRRRRALSSDTKDAVHSVDIKDNKV